MTASIPSRCTALAFIGCLAGLGNAFAGIPFLQTASETNLTLVQQVAAGGRVVIANVKNSTEQSWILASVECNIGTSLFGIWPPKETRKLPVDQILRKGEAKQFQLSGTTYALPEDIECRLIERKVRKF